jgi:peroxiredoxin Q/BCP
LGSRTSATTSASTSNDSWVGTRSSGVRGSRISTEACQFNDNLQQFQQAGVPVIGVSPDDTGSHVKFRNKYGLKFELLSDPGHGTMAAYGAWGERPGRGEGVIRSTVLLDPDGTVKRAWYGVKADGHAAEVLQALNS